MDPSIARVFPRRTSFSPTDEDCYFGEPPPYAQRYDKVHISVAFSWDLRRAAQLARNWVRFGRVTIGGPAVNDQGGEFTPGLYLKKGVTITSRGCPNKCSFCLVPQREGGIRELPIRAGHIIQDNNLLACSREHIGRVFQMLRSQKRICFSGGLESRRVEDWVIDELRSLKIRHIWLSFDSILAKRSLITAVQKLKRYFSRDQIRCYVLIGGGGDTLQNAEARLKMAWMIGTLPFAMRFRKPAETFRASFFHRARAWNLLARQWSRPAIIKAIMKEGAK